MQAALSATLRDALRWWLGELRACLPRRLANAVFGDPRRLMVRSEAGRIVLSLAGSEGSSALGTVAPAPAREMAAALRTLLRRRGLEHAPVTAVLGPGSAIETTVDLPVAALSNLGEVIAFEMDRLTPFRAEDVFFDHAVLGTDEAMERLSVRLLVARRADVMAAVETCRALGLRPSAVSGDEAGGDGARAPMNLLPEAERARTSQVLPRLTAAMALLCALTFLSAVVTDLGWRERSLAQSEDRLAELTRLAGSAAEQERARVRLADLATHVQALRRARPGTVGVLDALSAALPDAHWLQSLTIEGDAIAIRGVSRDASVLLGLIEASPAFHAARFAAPVQRDNAAGTERFSIAARLTAATGGGP
ncbi:MAG: PilN domain-containing protein [Pseudomonadota bacterium]